MLDTRGMVPSRGTPAFSMSLIVPNSSSSRDPFQFVQLIALRSRDVRDVMRLRVGRRMPGVHAVTNARGLDRGQTGDLLVRDLPRAVSAAHSSPTKSDPQ